MANTHINRERLISTPTYWSQTWASGGFQIPIILDQVPLRIQGKKRGDYMYLLGCQEISKKKKITTRRDQK